MISLPKIGVSGCGYELSCNIDELTGLSLKRLALLSTEERGIDFLRAKEKSAAKIVERNYMSLLTKEHELPLIKHKIRKGNLGYDFKSIATDVKIEITNFRLHKFYKTVLRSISFISDSKKKRSIVISSGETNTTIAQTINVGLNRIELNHEIKYPTFTLDFKSCGIQIAQGTTCNCYDDCYCQDFEFRFYKDGVLSNIDGICCEFTVELDEAAIIKEVESHLIEPLKYMTGIEICREGIVSDSVDYIVQNSKKSLQVLLAMWTETKDPITGEYHKHGYPSMIKEVVERTKGIILNQIPTNCKGAEMVTII